MQQTAWAVSLLLMAVIVAIFMWVVWNASAKSAASASPYRLRVPLFWIALAAGAVIAYQTLTPWPLVAHAKSAAAPDVVIKVTGHQWRWDLSQDTVPAGQEVEFQVTSADVNHGFALYRNKTQLLTQTQVMPGYVNKLRYTFAEPGEYEVLCL
ncbi:MAG: cytochrome C oxidase subunit II [Betaproteobacteria bacterium]|nr:cytochrome C oxidase subunit II [Betaproteobacteria bacterium]